MLLLGGLLGQCSDFLGKAAKLASYVLQNIPWGSNTMKSDLQVVCDLGGKILSDVKDTAIGNTKHSILVFHTLIQDRSSCPMTLSQLAIST